MSFWLLNNGITRAAVVIINGNILFEDLSRHTGRQSRYFHSHMAMALLVLAFRLRHQSTVKSM